MERSQRAFLDNLLETSTPSGFEAPGQRLWIEYVEEFADDVRVDEYGNAVAVVDGGEPTVAIAGHSDEIGFMVRDIGEDGSVRMTAVGGSDKTVSRGQHVQIHTDNGAVTGVIGQTAIHMRDSGEESVPDINEQHIDIGAADADEAAELIERGDPITFQQTVSELENGRVSARGLDNRIGIWTAAETLRRVASSQPEPKATVCAVSTVQEELGLRGARMVGFDLAPDAIIAVDVTHATDAPGTPGERNTGVELGGGPVVARGSANHPKLVAAVRDVADESDISVQLQATGSRTGTDADAFYTARGGIPALNVGIPNRYMHTPVELLELADLDSAASLLSEFAVQAHRFDFTTDFDR